MPGPKGKDPSKSKSKQGAASGAGQKPPAKDATGKAAGLKLASPKGPAGTSSEPIAEQGPSIEDLFTKLEGHVKKNEYSKIVKQADAILKLLPGDADALKCKVTAQIQDGRVEDALETILGVPVPGPDCRLEKAYCLYKQNKHSEALEALQDRELDAARLQLEAQILYRMGRTSDCIQRYKELEEKEKGLSSEIKTNIIAAYVAGGRAAEVPALIKTLQVSPRESFDVAYNTACGMIERGELEQAEEMLLLAKRVGQETLIEEEFTEAEIEDELAPIAVQLAYVQQVMGRSLEAQEGYNALIKRKPTDPPSLAVASNNLVALRGARELFDGLKKFDKLVEKTAEGRLAFPDELEGRLSAKQKAAIVFNRLLLLLHSNKLDQAQSSLPSSAGFFPDPHWAALLGGSLLVKEGQLAKAMELLSKAAAQAAPSSQALHMLRAQVAATSGELLGAAQALEAVEELRQRPAMVATIVDLKERGGDLAGAEATLDSAVAWWEGRMEEGAEEGAVREAVALAAADLKLRHGNPRGAAQLYERLLKSPTLAVQAQALNGLVTSAAAYDSAMAQKYESDMAPIPGASSLDAAALERAASAPSFSSRAKRAAEGAEEGGEPQKTKKRRKKKKTIWPKGYDPANPPPPPDPERWLPKRERSSYKPKRKDKRAAAAQIRGAQGAIVREKPGEGSEGKVGSGAGSSAAAGGAGKGAKGSASAGGAKEKVEPPPGIAKKKGKKGRR